MRVDIVKPSVTISGLDLGNSVDSVEIISTINQVPTARLSLHKVTDAIEVQAPLTESYLDSIGAIQANRADGTPVQEVTVTVKLSGDQDDEYTFIGLPIGPEAQVSDRMFSSGIRLLHPVCKLNVLQPYIYSAVPGVPGNIVQNGVQQEVVSDSTEASGGNFMKRMYVLLEERIEDFEKLISQAGWIDGATQTYVSDMHARNKSVLDMFFSLATDSDEPTYESLEQVLSDGLGDIFVNRNINDFIGSYLSNSREDFLSNLFGFLNATQCYYAPPSTNDAADYFGRIRPNRTMMGIGSEEVPTKEISPNFLGLSSADTKNDTTTTVMVTGVPAAAQNGLTVDNGAHSYIPPGLNFSTFIAVGGGAPEGNAATVPLPPWLTQYFTELMQTPAENTVDTTLDISTYKATRDGVLRKVQNIYKNELDKLIREYATNILYDLQYAPYSVIVRVPLDMSWEVGVRSKIICRRKLGDIEFDGFLQTVMHKIVSQKGAEESFTTLTFSHVKFP